MAKRVIVVDDSKSIRQAVSLVLLEAGYQVVEAADGEEGLKKIRAFLDTALVVCDINMPNMDGITMVETLHKEGLTATMPVVMLTTEAEASLVSRAKAAGAKGWIIKPFKPELFLMTVRKLAGAA